MSRAGVAARSRRGHARRSARRSAWPFALLAVLLPLAAFGVLAAAARGEQAELFGDGTVMDVLEGLAPVSSDDVHIDPILDVATRVVAGLTVLLLLALLVRRHWRAALFVVAGIGVPALLSTIAKETVERPAIEGPRDAWSFPSGSATWSMATLAVLVLLADNPRQRRLVLLVGVPFVLGYAAIVAWEQWHHPTDVLAAWCLGFGAAAGVWLALGRPAARVLP